MTHTAFVGKLKNDKFYEEIVIAGEDRWERETVSPPLFKGMNPETYKLIRTVKIQRTINDTVRHNTNSLCYSAISNFLFASIWVTQIYLQELQCSCAHLCNNSVLNFI